MSGTIHRLEWACTTADMFEMTERELGRSGLPDDVPQEDAEHWALNGLREAMEAAGQEWIDAHPGLFKVGLT